MSVFLSSLRRAHCIGGCNSPSWETEKKRHRWRSDHRCMYPCSVKKEARYETRKKKTRRDKKLGE